MHMPSPLLPTPSPATPGSGLAVACNEGHKGNQGRWLFSGFLTASLLWLLALYSLGGASSVVSVDQRSLSATGEAPLHVSGDYSLSLKRFFSRYQNQPGSGDAPDFLALLIADFPTLVVARVVSPSFPHTLAPKLEWPQHLSLNIPRAPPQR